MPRNDEEITFVRGDHPEQFSKDVNYYLKSGNWRVAQTEMSVTDSHYCAILIRSVPDQKDCAARASNVKE